MAEAPVHLVGEQEIPGLHPGIGAGSRRRLMYAKSDEPGDHAPPRLGCFLGYQLECQHAVAEVLDLGFMAVIRQ